MQNNKNNIETNIESELETNDELDALSKLSTLKKKFLILENELNQKLKDNEELKLNNQQLLKEIQKLNLNSKPFDSNREGHEITINNLKELIKEKENEIIKLKNEKNIFNFIEYENNNLLAQSSISKISQLNDSEKIEKYKKKIEEYKERLKANELQLQMLRNEIKDLRNENEKIKSFEGKINSYDDFLSLFNIAFDNYKPKKKEQEDAFKKIKLHLNEGNNNNGNKIDKKKKGFMGMFK